jgi:23S rRNA pseudouridine2605 synthase
MQLTQGMPDRLQKLIARAGIASRRTAEKLIQAGAVRVNGKVITTLGAKADPHQDRIEVEGRVLRFPTQDTYLLLNKPRGYVTTASDPQGRPTVFHLLRKLSARVFAVGRLAYDVEGLLLLTNDGAFADTVSRGRLPQTYWVKVKGKLSTEEIGRVEAKALRRSRSRLGLRLVRLGANPWYEVAAQELRDDWLRTLFFRLGHPVEKLRRVGIGSLRDTRVSSGQFRRLTEREVNRLSEEAAGSGDQTRRSHRRAG